MRTPFPPCYSPSAPPGDFWGGGCWGPEHENPPPLDIPPSDNKGGGVSWIWVDIQYESACMRGAAGENSGFRRPS